MIINIQSKADVLSFFHELSKNEYDPIGREEEKELIGKYRNGDGLALQSLIQKNLRFVVACTLKLLDKNEIIDDLDIFNAGVLGLVTAIERFKLDMERKLITYATFWIRHEVQKYKRESKVVNFTHYINFNIQKAEDAITSLEIKGQKYTKEDVLLLSGLTDTRYQSVQKAKQVRCFVSDFAEAERMESLKKQEVFMDPLDCAIQKENIELIQAAMKLLPENEADIIKRRYFGNSRLVPSYRAIGKETGYCHEQIRKIELKGLERLRNILGNQYNLNNLN